MSGLEVTFQLSDGRETDVRDCGFADRLMDAMSDAGAAITHAEVAASREGRGSKIVAIPPEELAEVAIAAKAVAGLEGMPDNWGILL